MILLIDSVGKSTKKTLEKQFRKIERMREKAFFQYRGKVKVLAGQFSAASEEA